MSIVATSIAFLVVLPTSVSSSCDMAGAMQKMTPCVAQMSHSSGGSICDGWNSAVCCLKNEFSSCGPDFSSTLDMVLGQMKGMPGTADVSSCANPTSCSGGSSGETSTPVAVKQAIDTLIEFPDTFDPTNFSLVEYVNELKGRFDADAAPEAIVSAWQVIIEYAAPEGTTDEQLKTAVSTAMNVAEDLIEILMGVRRLTSLRQLSVDKKVSITASDATKAKELKIATQGTEALDSLKTALGGDVSVKTLPKTKVQVKTSVTSTKTKGELETELKESTIVKAAGGTITIAANQNTLEPESSSGLRSGMMVVTSMALALAAGNV